MNLFSKLCYNTIKLHSNNIPKYDIDKICCFSGHRPQNLPWKFNENDERCILMKERTKIKIIESINSGYEIFISGMAIGYDMICAELIIELKKKYPFIKLFCALPCKNQSNKWNKVFQIRYDRVLSNCDKIICLNELYTSNCMQERNEYMINNSSRLITFFNGQNGGTKNTINYALKKSLNIIYV